MAQGLFTLKQQLQGVIQKAWNAPFGTTYGAKFAGSGSGQYLTGPTTSALNFSTGNFTVEMWLYMNAYGGGGLTVVFSASNASADFQISLSNSGSYLYWHNSGVQIGTSATAFALGRWTHIALVRSGTSVALFANGVRVGTATNSAAINLTNFNVGSYWNSPVAYMVDGWVSNLRITNTAVYDPTATSYVLPTTALTAISGTQLLTLQNATIVDNSTNALTITNNGSVATQIVTPFGIQQKTPAVDYLVVAGGGGGANGGGGAGGLLQGSVPVTAGSSITVTIGAGGAGGTSSAVDGQNSVFGSIAARGGGRGSRGVSGSQSDVSGGAYSGGSGGGAYQTSVPGFGTPGQGNSGGNNGYGSPSSTAGGGGGAGTIGLNTLVNYTGANGGGGIASAISGTVTAYAGGGAGGGYQSVGVGGVGGGGNAGFAGTVNTGGGGGGYRQDPGNLDGGTGGSGIVILSYPDIYAGAAATTGSPTVSTSGSGSMYFSGTSQYLSTLSSSGFAFGTGDFTVEAWIYANSLSGERGFFQTSATAGGLQTSYVDGVIIVINPAGNGINANLGNTTITSGNAITVNTWYHVAFTRSSGSCRLFINGVLFAGPTTITANVTGTYAAIGGYYTNSFLWNGNVSNLRVVKGTAVYTSTFTPSTVPLTAISGTSLLMNAVSGAQFADSSSNSLTLTATGSPTWNQSSPFATGLGYKNRVYTYTGSGTITF
jgi:hypothetical protein